MCDFSLQSVRSRPAKVGDKLITRDFGTGTRGFAAADDRGLAVCVMPGTELAFGGNFVPASKPIRVEEQDKELPNCNLSPNQQRYRAVASRCARIS